MDNPCCCIPLRKGVLTIAILDIIVGSLGAALGVFAFFATIIFPASLSSSTEEKSNSTTTTTPTTPTNGTEEAIKHPGSGATKSAILVLFVLWVLYCLMQVLFGVVLIKGLAKEKLVLLKAWLGFRVSGALFTLATFIAFVFLREEATLKPSIVDGVSLLVSLYCIYVVYVLALELKHANAAPKNLKPKTTPTSPS